MVAAGYLFVEVMGGRVSHGSRLGQFHCNRVHLDFDISQHSKPWFVRNMVEATQESTSLLISGGSAGRHSINNERKRNFRIFRGEDARGDPSHVPKETSDELDG